MENVKLLRKVKKISQRQAMREQIEMQSSYYDVSKILFDECHINLTNEDYFNKLSDELILQIFKWIPRPTLLKFARVSKRWHKLMLDESLWRRYDLSNKTVQSELLIKLLNRGIKILGLGRSEIKKSTKKSLNQPENGIINLSTQIDFYLINPIKLECVDLTNCSIETNSLNSIIKHTKFLKKISLESLNVDNETFYHLGSNKQIDTLNICLCNGVTVDGLIMILSSLKLLKSLNIGWANLDRESVSLVCKHLPSTLEKLNISGCKTTLLDNDIQNLVLSCPNLIELDLSDAQSLTDSSVQTIACHLEKIEYIAFSRCYLIKPSSYFLLSSLNKLTGLDLFNILKDKSLDVLKSYIPSLKFMNKYYFSTIARPIVDSQKCPSIWGNRLIQNTIKDN